MDFPFAFDPRYARAARPFGIGPGNAWVRLTGDTIEARYGRWRVVTPLANVTAASITGPFAFVKTAGPARLAVTDQGLTFASNGDRGVLLTFAERVRGIERFGLIRHPELTVTVADPEGLVAAVDQSRHSLAASA